MALHAGPRRARSAWRGSFIPTPFCLAAGGAPIFATRARSMCCASPPPAPARASAWSCRRLLTWPGLAIVHDIKGENWGLTAGWRARFGQALLFDPTNPQSAAYNPLLEVLRGNWRSATSRTSPTCWSTPKARSRNGTNGKRPATPCSSAPSFMCFTPRRTKHSPGSPASSPTRSARSRRRSAR
jgi:hypothetical protein